MYTVKVYCRVDDKPEMARDEILGTYKTWDEATEVAQIEFDAIKECIYNDPDIHFNEDEDRVICFSYNDSEYIEKGGHFVERITENHLAFGVRDCHYHRYIKICCVVSIIEK